MHLFSASQAFEGNPNQVNTVAIAPNQHTGNDNNAYFRCQPTKGCHPDADCNRPDIIPYKTCKLPKE